MANTHIGRSAEHFARTLRATDEGRRVLAAAHDLIEDRECRPYIDAIGQPHKGWTEGEVAAFARVNSLVAAGGVQKVRIPVGSEPGRDSERLRNADTLRVGLPPEFSAEVYEGNSHDGDGLLSWRDAAMPWVDEAGSQDVAQLLSWHPWAPLEIGATNASRTFLHLLETGTVARWPYHSDDIWVFGFVSIDAWAEWRNGPADALAKRLAA